MGGVVNYDDIYKHPNLGGDSTPPPSKTIGSAKVSNTDNNKVSGMYLGSSVVSAGSGLMSNAFIKWKDVGSDTERIIYFQTIPDSGFSFSKGANYESIEIPGRNEPIKTWTGSSEKKIPISLTFAAVGTNDVRAKVSDLIKGSNNNQLKSFNKINDNAYGQILANMRALEALVYGGRSGEAPPKVHLRFGVFFTTKTTIPCIVENVDIQAGSSGAYELSTYIPKIVTIELDLTVQHDFDQVPHYESILKDIDLANGGKDLIQKSFRVIKTESPNIDPNNPSNNSQALSFLQSDIAPRSTLKNVVISSDIRKGKEIKKLAPPVNIFEIVGRIGGLRSIASGISTRIDAVKQLTTLTKSLEGSVNTVDGAKRLFKDVASRVDKVKNISNIVGNKGFYNDLKNIVGLKNKTVPQVPKVSSITTLLQDSGVKTSSPSIAGLRSKSNPSFSSVKSNINTVGSANPTQMFSLARNIFSNDGRTSQQFKVKQL